MMSGKAICQECKVEVTPDGEWVMDEYRCPSQKEYCLNCCGCDEHSDEEWY